MIVALRVLESCKDLLFHAILVLLHAYGLFRCMRKDLEAQGADRGGDILKVQESWTFAKSCCNVGFVDMQFSSSCR